MDAQTLNLTNGHLGDVVMAMPAMRAGDSVIVGEPHRVPGLDVTWLDSGHGVMPQVFPGRHMTDAWLLATARPAMMRPYPLSQEDKDWAQREFGADYTLLCPSVRAPEKNWPYDRWHALSKAIGGQVILLGADELDCRGRWAAVLRNASCVVAPDTGTIHVADALLVPKVVGLYGPTDPKLFGPYWSRKNCIHRDSMDAISVDDVLEIING